MEKLDKILANVGDLGYRRRILTLLNYLNIKDNDTVLDCGCGEGFYTMVLSELYNCKIWALDNDEKLLEIAKERIGLKSNIIFRKGDINSLPFEDEVFDKIILTEVLEHISDDKKSLCEVYRVLKKGGTVGITVPNHNYPFLWDPLNKIREWLGLGHFHPDNHFLAGIWSMHIRLYYPDQLMELVESTGFRLEKIEGLTHYCLPFNHNILYLGKQLYTHLPVPKSIYKSMEKFEWKDIDSKRSRFNLFQLTLNLLKWIDSFNDRRNRLNRSSVCIAANAVK